MDVSSYSYATSADFLIESYVGVPLPVENRSVHHANRPTLAILIPVLNEAKGLPELHRRLSISVAELPCRTTFLFINDGSTDESLAVLHSLKRSDSRIGVINLSRRFGKEYAVTAGLDIVDADAVILMDADLQDPPDCIPAMVEAWQSGFDVVAMRRIDRVSDSWFKRNSAQAFYRMMSILGDVQLPPNVGDFRLISRRVVQTLKQLQESNRCLKTLLAWVGYPTTILDYVRPARHADKSGWSLLSLIGLAIDAITSFSISPLRVATIVGTVTALLSILFGILTVVKTLLWGDPVAGFTTLLTITAFLGGIQLLAIGLMGEYVGRMFLEVKQRPLYVVESIEPAKGQEAVNNSRRGVDQAVS